MANRFDRWISNPQEIALPQCFDEFLTLHELPCLVKGCEWRGKALTLHMNQTHGVTSRQFKKLAGFNIGSGIISQPLREILEARDNVGVALIGYSGQLKGVQPKEGYISLEAREHRKKARALTGCGPTRTCIGCGASFAQKTPFGKALFHSFECRNKHYAENTRSRKYKLSCVWCGTGFMGSVYQKSAAEKGNPVVCGHSCKGKLNSRKRKCKTGAEGYA